MSASRTWIIVALFGWSVGLVHGSAADDPVAAPSEPSAGDESHAAPPDSSSEAWQLKKPKVSGYVQAHYRYAYATGEDSLVDYSDFRIQRVRICFTGDVLPRVSYDVEIDPRAPDISGVLRDAFTTFKGIPGMPRQRLRVGQQKTQFGYENNVSSSHLYVVNRAEVSDALSRGITLRDIGLGLLGNLKMGGAWRFENAITLVNGAGMNVQADDTKRKSAWGRLGVRHKAKDERSTVMDFGVSGASGDQMDEGDLEFDPADDFRLSFTRLGADVEVDNRRCFLAAEYVQGSEENTVTGETDDPNGYYVLVVGKVREKFGPLVRYDVFADEVKRWTFGGFYGLPDARLRFLVNYELRTLNNGARGDDKLYVWEQIQF